MIITVVGLGVIGGSFVKALKGKGYDVYGVDCDQQTLEMAKAEGCIIEGYLDGHQIISQSDLTIICLYPSKVLDFISEHTFKKGSIVTDVVGIKSYFLNQALSRIDQDVEYISGHPMAGREKKGYLYASQEVFQNANYIVIQHEHNQIDKIDWMRQFVGQLGFKSVKIMSPYDHDEIISYTSQLPHTLAVALMNSDDEKYETGKYIGDSFRDLTRIANINADLWAELFFHNRDYVWASRERFEKQFDLLKQAIASGDEKSLKEMFWQSSKRREKLEK